MCRFEFTKFILKATTFNWASTIFQKVKRFYSIFWHIWTYFWSNLDLLNETIPIWTSVHMVFYSKCYSYDTCSRVTSRQLYTHGRYSKRSDALVKAPSREHCYLALLLPPHLLEYLFFYCIYSSDNIRSTPFRQKQFQLWNYFWLNGVVLILSLL